MRPFRFQILVLSLGFLFLWIGLPFTTARALPAAAVTLTSLVNCPASGCAAGQRLNFKVDYSISQADLTKNPNVQVCVFTPANWAVPLPIQFSSASHVYSNDNSHCSIEAAPSNYSPAVGVSTQLQDNSTGDSLSFGFRLGLTASNTDAVLIRVYEQNASGAWVKINGEVNSPAIKVIAKSSSVYVATDAVACTKSPCYVNSRDDLADGIGTGLKDAIDAADAPATITLLGNVNIKENTVVLNKAHVLKGENSARITYSGLVCNQAMLNITDGATITGLTIEDGQSCTSPSRDLIVVNSSKPVNIESNDLLNGQHAITVSPSNTAALTVRFNQITGNNGYAIQLLSGNSGVLEAVGNNFKINRTGVQVDCGSTDKGTVNHNYWGEGLLASAGSTNCTVNDAKRLGAEILHNPSTPGVQVQMVTVNTTLQTAFNEAVRFQRNNQGSDFGLYIVNHGSGSLSNIPFTAGQTGNLRPCSNYWDIFFANSTGPGNPTTLDLYFKYNLSSACVTAVESALYCGQSASPSSFPLWWYDLSSANWITTGAAGGQPTICHTDTDEIQVTIDGVHDRPGFNELQKLPFVVGIPAQAVAVTFSTLTAQSGNNLATLSWTTSSEINMAGYYVQRSITSSSSGFVNVSTLQPRKGTGSGGASYQYTDSNLINNTPYYYRILVVGYDGSNLSSGVAAVTPTIPTATRTLTRFPTSTFIFRTATRTATRTSTPTSPFKTITNTPSITPTSLTRTVTPSPTGATGSPVPTTAEAATELASTRQARTAEAFALLTPTVTPDSGQNGTGPITAVMAVLAVGAVLGGAFYLIREQRLSH